MVTGTDDVTLEVVTWKVALVAPAAMVTLAGVVAAAALEESVTTAPPVGAAVVSVAVPVDAAPPTTLDGFNATVASDGAAAIACGVNLRTTDHALAVPAEFTACTRHQCCRAPSVGAVNCDEVTVLSTTNGAANVLESSTWTRYDVAPGTSDQSTTNGWAGVAPCAGLTKAGAVGAGGVTVNVALRVLPPDEPEMLTVVEDVTAVVVTVNVLLVVPAGTVTLAGTVAAAEVSDRVTTVPPAGAAAVRVTVPVDEAPPATLDGLRASADRVGPAAARVMDSAAN
jgi:hypothetical protein